MGRMKGWPPPEARRISRGLGWHVYALTDPRDGQVHYIGFCREFSKRPWNHWGEVARKYRAGPNRVAWLDGLRESGAGPYTVRVLERFDSWDGGIAGEVKWIEHALDAGWPLANMRVRGGVGQPPVERRSPSPCGCPNKHRERGGVWACLEAKHPEFFL